MTNFNVDVPKELQEKILQLVERTAKARKLKIGVNEVTKMVERGQAKFVIVAQDVSPQEIVLHLGPLCKEKSIPLGMVSEKKDLGEKAGLKVGTSALAVLDEGDYKKDWDAIAKRFAELK